MSFGGGDSSGDKTWKIAKKQYKASKPIQRRVYRGLVDFLDNGMNVTESPMWQSGKAAVEGSYGASRDSILSQMPAGGALYGSIGQLEGARAKNLSDLAASIWQDQYNKAYGVATGAPQQSIANMAQIGAGLDQAQATSDAGNAQAAGGAAAGLGAIIAAMMFA